MSGKFFDEWVVGEEYMTPSRTITETDVVMFAAMSGDYNELHTSEEFMKNSQFGRRIVHGLLGLAISHGLLFKMKVTEKRPSKSKPDRGIVKLFMEVIKQDETVVQSGFKIIMIKRTPA